MTPTPTTANTSTQFGLLVINAAALTNRERQTLQCIADGLTSKQIADKFCVSEETIDTHRRNISRKLNVHNMVHAVAIAMRQQIIK